MGNILVKKAGKGEHCHRCFNEDGTKYIIICKNQKCIEHYCFDGKCKKRMYIGYWKHHKGQKTFVKHCDNNCQCHLSECSIVPQPNPNPNPNPKKQIRRNCRCNPGFDFDVDSDSDNDFDIDID